MADLTSTEASASTKIVGSNSSGVEQTPVQSTAQGGLHSNLRDNSGTETGISSNPLHTADYLESSGVNAAVTVGTSAVAARVGGSNLALRKLLSVNNTSNNIIYWGYTNAVTTASGMPIQKGQQVDWDAGPNITIYLIAGSAGNSVRVAEGA